MITSYEVGSIFKIIDQASPQLRTILKLSTALDASIQNVRKNLTGLARTRLVGVGGQIKAITQETVGLDKALGGAAGGIVKITKASTALAGTRTEIAGTTTAASALAAEWRNVAASASSAVAAMRAAGRVRMPPLLTGPGGVALPPPLPGGRSPRGPRPGWHLGRFGVGIPVAGGHVHASTISSPAGVGVGAGLFGVYELMKNAKEPLHQEAMLKLLGIDQPTIGKMSKEARDIAIAVPGSGYSKNMKSMGELYSIVGAQGAMEIAPKLAEIDRVQSIIGGKGKDQGSAYVLTRATELMGKLTNPVTHQIDLKLFGTIIDNMSKMSIASHGKVTPEEWLNYAKQAGPAAGNLSVEGLYTTSAIIQAMGGHRAGTAAAAIQRQFAGGVMTASKAKELEAIGIFKPGDYEVGKGGHILVKNDAAKSFVDKLQKDPLDAVVKDLIPALESHGFTTNEAVTKELYRILGTAPAQREVYEIIRGHKQIEQERERAKAALPPSAAISSLNANDPIAVTSAFTTSFKDLLGALGGPLMTAAVPGMVGLTKFFNTISATATSFPATTGVVSSIGAGAAIGGATGFGVGWLGGPFGAGAGALVGAGAGAGYGVWNALPQSMREGAGTGFGLGLKTGVPLASVMGGMVGGVWGGLGGLFGGETPAKGAWNVVPPPQKIDIAPAKVTLNMDGRAVGEAVLQWMVASGNGPAHGSPYPDATRGGSSFDLALVP